VPGRHQRSPGKRGHVERARVLAIHQIAGAAQVREVGELFRGHAASIRACQPRWGGQPPGQGLAGLFGQTVIVSPTGTIVSETSVSIFGLMNVATACWPISLSMIS
jgi:hypothetical protein